MSHRINANSVCTIAASLPATASLPICRRMESPIDLAGANGATAIKRHRASNRQGVPRHRPRRAFQPRQRRRIPDRKYAVFTYREHISTIRRSVAAIRNLWLPASGFKVADAPNFERYDERFDPLTGNGGFEIWVPVKE